MADAFTDAVKAELTKWQSDKSSMTPAQARALVAAIKGEPAPKPNLAAVLEKRPASAVPTPEPSELPAEEPTVEVLVASGGPGMPVEENAQRLTSMSEIGQRLYEVAGARPPLPGQGGQYVRAGRRQWSTPHRFDSGTEDNFTTQREVMREAQAQARAEVDGAPSTLQAASGICGPLQPSYSLNNIASAIDGVIQLPDLEATRGGYRIAQSLTFDDMRGEPAVAYPYTSQMGEDGGTKPCLTVECPGISDFEVTAYQTCATFGNFQRVFFPEFVAHITELLEATHAQRVSQALVAAILADVNTVDYDSNGATKGGDAWNQFVRQSTFAAWLYRGKYRTAQDLVLDQVWPYRAKGALIADLMPRDSSTPTAETFRVDAALQELQRAIGVRFQWIYDGLAPSMESLPGDFSNEPYEFLTMPPGAAMHMSGTTLDFGIFQDSATLSRNESTLWFESFDGVAFSGLEIAHATEVVLCPTGATGERVTLPCSGAGS